MFPNACDKTIPEALRFLSENPRPTGGEDRFNAIHLLQLAEEAECAFTLTMSGTSNSVVDRLKARRALLKDRIELRRSYNNDPHPATTDLIQARVSELDYVIGFLRGKWK